MTGAAQVAHHVCVLVKMSTGFRPTFSAMRRRYLVSHIKAIIGVPVRSPFNQRTAVNPPSENRSTFSEIGAQTTCRHSEAQAIVTALKCITLTWMS